MNHATHIVRHTHTPIVIIRERSLQRAPLRTWERRHGEWSNEGPWRWRRFSCYLSRPGVNRLVTPLGIDESLALRAFDKTVIFGHWLSKSTKIGIGLRGLPFEKGFYYILVDSFFSFFFKSFSKISFFKREALKYFYMGLYHFPHMSYSFPHMLYNFPSHALQLSFICKHRVAKFNFCYTFIYFHIYIYIYIYFLCLEMSFPFIKDCMTYTPCVVTSLWGFHHLSTDA